MIYLYPENGVTKNGFWPFWPDPQTKWQIIKHTNGQYFIVSGPGMRVPGKMIYTYSDRIDSYSYWPDP